MPSISLDDFNGAVDAKFEDVVFDVTGNKVARFVQPLRLPEASREEVGELAPRFVANDFESEEELRITCLRFMEVCAKTKTDFNNMKRHLADDTARTIVAVELLLEAYGGLMGMGEASSSES